MALKDRAKAGQRRDARLKPRAAEIKQADDRRAGGERLIQRPDDFLRLRRVERAIRDGEVLGMDIDRTAADGAPPGDDAVAWIIRVCGCKFLKRAGIE